MKFPCFCFVFSYQDFGPGPGQRSVDPSREKEDFTGGAKEDFTRSAKPGPGPEEGSYDGPPGMKQDGTIEVRGSTLAWKVVHVTTVSF